MDGGLSLARAVLAQPDIFIMDEATASVDTLTETLIQHGMDNLMKQSTSFVIAHRLSTIRNATRIVVIEDGRIKEMGTHRELLKLGGHYHRLYTQQFRQEVVTQVDELATLLADVDTAAIEEAPEPPSDGRTNGKVKADMAFAD